MSGGASTFTPRHRLKDAYWVKTFKWYLYKRRFGSRQWMTRYLFDGCLRRLTADDLVIDCGANLGEFTLAFARTGARVHAFEPDPYTFERLRNHTAQLPNVTCHRCAVGVAAGRIRLYRRKGFENDPGSASKSSSVFADKLNVDVNHAVEVEQIDLAEFLTSLGRPTRVLKMDIEGAEVPVLERLIDSGAIHCCELVFAETHETRIPSLADRTARLRRAAEQSFAGTLFLDWH